MAATWNIVNVEYTISTDQVTSLHWEVADGTEVVGHGETQVSTPMTYSNLNENQAIAFVKADLGARVGTIESSLATQRAELETPTQATGIPWGA